MISDERLEDAREIMSRFLKQAHLNFVAKVYHASIFHGIFMCFKSFFSTMHER